MSTPPPDPTHAALHRLAQERAALAQLAARLLADAHGGEDVVQDGAVRLLRSAPELPRDGGAFQWLRTLTQRLASNERRSRRWRSEREELAAPQASVAPSSAEVAARLEASRLLHDAIDALPEIQASAIRDHYLGGVAIAALAERDGVSVVAMRSRVRRAREALRELLDRNGLAGDRRPWALTLAPLAASAPLVIPAHTALPAGSIAGLLMMKKILAAVLLLALATVTFRLATIDRAKLAGPDAPASPARTDRSASDAREQLSAPVGSETPDQDAERTAAVDRPAAVPLLEEPVTAPALKTLIVRSKVGVAVDSALSLLSESGVRKPMVALSSGAFEHPGSSWVVAPGHRPRKVIPSDSRVELDPVSVLRVRADGLRDAVLSEVDGEEWVPADRHALMVLESSCGFLSNGEFALVLDHERWPNHNLRLSRILKLRDGRNLSIEFLPVTATSERVGLSLGPSRGVAPRKELRARFASAVAPGAPVSLQVALLRNVDPLVEPKVYDWGKVELADPWSFDVLALEGAGPWNLGEHVVGRTYRVAARGPGGVYGSVDVSFDGSVAAIPVKAGVVVDGRIVDDRGALVSDVSVQVKFEAVGRIDRDAAREWSQASGELWTPLEQTGDGVALALPLAVPRTIDVAWPMPTVGTMTFQAPGHQSRSVAFDLAGITELPLGDVVLPRRAGGLLLTGAQEDLERGVPYQMAWVSSQTQRSGYVEVADSVRTSSGDWKVFPADDLLLEREQPTEMYLLHLGAVRSRRTGRDTYRIDTPQSVEPLFVLEGPFAKATDQVDLAVDVGGMRIPLAAFYREALGNQRRQRLFLPRNGAALCWRETADPTIAAMDWRELAQVEALPEVIRLSID